MKNKFYDILLSAISKLDFPADRIIIHVPKNPEHGDFTTNYPMINCKEIGKPPMEVALIIVDEIKKLSD